MDIIEDLNYYWEESIKASIKEDYGVEIIPIQLSEVDIGVNEVMDSYRCIGKDEQDRLDEYIYEGFAWFLLRFGIRMATYSLRLSDQRYFTNGLCDIGMTQGVLDIRDILVILPLYCDAQKKTGLSFDEALSQNSKFTSTLRDFIGRDERNKTLSCMGYVCEIDENNIPTYQRTW